MRGCGALPHPSREQSPLHPILTLTAGQEGKPCSLSPLRATASWVRHASRSSRCACRLRRTLTLHRAADELHRSSHDAAERGARGTAGGSAPEDKEARRAKPLACSVSSSISYPDRGRGSPAPLPSGERGVKARSARGESPSCWKCRGALLPARGSGDSVPTNLEG